MRIIAFDPGMNLGYCVLDNGEHSTSGGIKNDASIPMTARMEHIKRYIDSLLSLEPDLIAVEAINRMQGKVNKKEINQSSWTLYWVFGEIVSRAEEKGVKVLLISPLTMKACLVPAESRDEELRQRFRTPTKDEVKQAVQVLIGERKMRSDESDAVGLAITAWRIHTGQYVVNSKKPKSKKK